MAEEPRTEEKTEPPTPKRRQDARKEGQVALSREVTSAALLALFAAYFYFAGEASLTSLASLWRGLLSEFIHTPLTADSAYRIFWETTRAVASWLVLLLLLVMAVALLAVLFQIGPLLVPLKWQWKRLNPWVGLQRIFSVHGLAELGKSLFKMIVIGAVTYQVYRSDLAALLALSQSTLGEVFLFNFNILGQMLLQVALALALLAVLDLLFQRWQHERKLRMTRQEVREELKQTEGDQQLRARIRSAQRQLSQARMMEDIPRADVVVSNPTHYAVAITYDRQTMDAPQVVAKGADFIARRIREIAEEYDVPRVENATLARDLYQHVDIGETIPERFFRTVAELLAYVYRLKNQSGTPASVRPSANSF